MTTPEEDKEFGRQKSLQAAVEARREVGDSYGPGAYFYWFLAQHLDPSDVRFADLGTDQPRTTHSSRSGRALLVTPRSLIDIDYADAVDDPDDAQQQGSYGTVNLTIRERTPGVHLTWKGRDLRPPNPGYGRNVAGARLPAGSLELSMNGWSVELPYNTRSNGDAYVTALTDALGLA